MTTGISFAQSLSPADLALLQRLGADAFKEGIALYLVGGSVRDGLLGLPVVDLDLTSETDASRVANVLIRSADGRVRAYSQFGTIKLELAGRTVDLATARSERYVRPGALPTVTPGTIREDLLRRDFSINAMATPLWPSAWGQVVDPTDGQQDIHRRLVRALHEDSFRDDATRILRAIRYTRRLGFRTERRTLGWMQRDVAYLGTISPPRVHREMGRILEEPKAWAILLSAQHLGALSAIHPALGKPEVAQALRAARRLEEPLALLGALLYGVRPEEAEAAAQRLALTARQWQVVRQVQELKTREPSLAGAGLVPHELVELVEHLLPASVRTLAATGASAVVRRLRRYLDRWRHIKPALNGDALVELGVTPGPQVGRLLRELRNGRVDRRLRSREAETAYVRAWLKREH